MNPAKALTYRQMFIDLADRIAHSGEKPSTWPTVNAVRSYARNCPVYFVASDMVTLAETAAATLPATTVTENLLASPTGWMIYDKPLADFKPEPPDPARREQLKRYGHDPSMELDGLPVEGMAWAVTLLPLKPDEDGELALLPGGEPTLCVYLAPLGEPPDLGVIVPLSAGPYYRIGDELSAAGVGGMALKFFATHILMQQTIAWVEVVRPPRSERRRGGSSPASNIVVVKLRKMDKPPEDKQGELVEWSHRWLVSGHWRQQWYPSASAHRPIWIHPHIKGPPGKPLVTKERIIAWVR